MGYVTLTPLLILILNLLILGFVAGLDRKSPSNKSFLLIAFLFAGWSGTDYIAWTTSDSDIIIPILRLQSVFYISLGFALIHFAYVFIEKEKDTFYYIILGTVLVMDVVTNLSNWIVLDFMRQPWGVSLVGGVFFVPGAFFIAIPQLYSLVILWKHRQNITDTIKRNQILFLVIGYCSGLFFVYLTWIILPIFFNINTYSLSYIGVLFFESMIFIAIVKYRFFSIGISSIANELFSQSQVGVAIVDSGKVLALNNQIRSMIGQTGDEQANVKALSFATRWHSHHRDTIDVQETIGKGDSERVVSITGSRIHGTGLQAGLIIFVKDITDSIRMQEALEQANADLASARDEAIQANRAKSFFLANMSHELRTPLNAIIGYNEMAIEELEGSEHESITKDLIRVNDSGRHLMKLINDILDLSKIEAGKMELFVETFELKKLVTETAEAIQPLVENNGNQLIVECSDSIGEMKADKTKIRQMLLNLLSNACKFTSQGSITLSVTKSEKENSVEFCVSDTGIGMNREQLNRIFQEFAQADASTTRDYGGTGLGLVISKRFCEMLGGTLSVESEPKKGSVFRAILPVEFTEPNPKK